MIQNVTKGEKKGVVKLLTTKKYLTLNKKYLLLDALLQLFYLNK
jgi:hypothetical protein